MTVFFDQPVSSRSAAVSSVMVMGAFCHRRFISFHSLLERSIFIAHLAWYTVVYLLWPQRSRKVDKCQPKFGYKKKQPETEIFWRPMAKLLLCHR